VGDRQKTCGGEACRREWHRRRCREWNRRNTAYYRENYLQKKLEETAGEADAGRSAPGSPAAAGPGEGGVRGGSRCGPVLLFWRMVPGLSDARRAVALEYGVHLLLRRARELLIARRM
jgi:hypothetical protein